MRAREYKEKFLHMMAEGYTVGDALLSTMESFIKEYNGMVGTGSGIVVYNALKQQNDKWRAFARSLPNYDINEDGFIKSIEHIKPKLYESYVAMGAILKDMKREKLHGHL